MVAVLRRAHQTMVEGSQQYVYTTIHNIVGPMLTKISRFSFLFQCGSPYARIEYKIVYIPNRIKHIAVM